MDYAKIGMRIRLFRQKSGLSQEQLAEMVDISVTHMSHIETGNTKLSLPVFVAISEALNICTDELLHDPNYDQTSVMTEVAHIFSSCNPHQTRCLIDILKAVKQSFDQHL